MLEGIPVLLSQVDCNVTKRNWRSAQVVFEAVGVGDAEGSNLSASAMPSAQKARIMIGSSCVSRPDPLIGDSQTLAQQGYTGCTNKLEPITASHFFGMLVPIGTAQSMSVLGTT